MSKRIENQIVQDHLAQLKLLQLPLLQRTIPSYICSLPLEEQQVLYKRARKWLWRYWDESTQSFNHPHYLASIGEYNRETLRGYRYFLDYAISD